MCLGKNTIVFGVHKLGRSQCIHHRPPRLAGSLPYQLKGKPDWAPLLNNLVDVLLDLSCHHLAGCGVYEHASHFIFRRLLFTCPGKENLLYEDAHHPPFWCFSQTTSWYNLVALSLGQPVETRGEWRGCSLSLATVPYSESPGQAHLVLHSQAAVGAHTKARAVLRWDDPLDRRKGSRQSKRNLETLIPLQNMITRDLVVDKGNSAQSTYQLSHVCTITQKYVALYGKGHQTQSLLVCHGILCLPKQGEFHPVLWHRNVVTARPMES